MTAVSKQVSPDSYDFGAALQRLRDGGRVQRAGWNGKGMWIKLAHSPTTFDDTTTPILPFIFMRTATAEYVPWLASQTDVLSNDWQDAQ